MDEAVLVRVRNLGKKFCKSVRQAMLYGLQDVASAMLGLGAGASASSRARPDADHVPPPVALRKDEFWALQDISFELERGERLAVIGPNGAGKSTLFKLLSGIMAPTRGRCEIHSRLSSLIEVGSGFHPQLTGRENIYINAAILGMSKKETDRKFDEIVEFAGVSDFIDSPIKFYSSGMYVRLGFSIAAHLEPQILLVDEVLAVGDMAFQAKCLEHMSRLADTGCSIIFVSHNEELVRRLCRRGLLLDRGRRVFEGDLDGCYRAYHELDLDGWIGETHRAGNHKVEIQDVQFLDTNGDEQDAFVPGERMTLRVHLVAHEPVARPILDVGFNSIMGYVGASANNRYEGCTIERLQGKCCIEITFPNVYLAPGAYRVSLVLFASDHLEIYDWRRNRWAIRIEGDVHTRGALYMPSHWRTLPRENG